MIDVHGLASGTKRGNPVAVAVSNQDVEQMIEARNVQDAEEVTDDTEAKEEKVRDDEGAKNENYNDDINTKNGDDAHEGEALVVAVESKEDADDKKESGEEDVDKDEGQSDDDDSAHDKDEAYGTYEEALKLAVMHGKLATKGGVRSPTRKPKAKKATSSTRKKQRLPSAKIAYA